MLRIAIVGTGGISALHCKAYLSFPERCRIVALCDTVPGKAEEARRKFHLDGVRVYGSHREMLRESYDLVSICTPPFTHAQIAAECLDAGCNVLVEKPMAASLEECDRMIEAERRSGKLLGVVAQNRFTDPCWKLKRVVESGEAGKVLFARVDSFWWRGHCYYDLWWRGAWKTEGGGCTLNHAVHHIDMLNWFLGRPESVTAVLANAAHDNAEVEDLSIGIFRYPDGALAQVTSSVIHHGEEQQLEFQCENARIAAPWKVAAGTSKANGFPERNEALEKKLTALCDGVPGLEHTGHTAEILDMLDAVELGGRPLIGSADGRLTIEVITAIYKAGFSGRSVALPLAADDPFRTVPGILAGVRRFHEKTASVSEFEDVGITVGGEEK